MNSLKGRGPRRFNGDGYDFSGVDHLMFLSRSQPLASPPPPILTESQTRGLLPQDDSAQARTVLTPADEGAGPGPSSEQLAGVAADLYNMLQERCGSVRQAQKRARLKTLILSKSLPELVAVMAQLISTKSSDEVKGSSILLEFWTNRAGFGARVVNGKPQKADLVLVDPAGGPSTKLPVFYETCPTSFGPLPNGRPEDFDALVPSNNPRYPIKCLCSTGGECNASMRRGRQLYLLRGAGRAAEAAFFAAEGTWQSACDAAMSAAVQWIRAFDGRYKPHLCVETEARKARLEEANAKRKAVRGPDRRKRIKAEGGGAGGEGSAGAPATGQAAGAGPGATAARAPEGPAGGAAAVAATGDAAHRNPRTSDAVRSAAMRGMTGHKWRAA